LILGGFTGGYMSSDFINARIHLENARHALAGSDATSCKAREALDLLIEAVATAGRVRPKAVLIELFGAGTMRRRGQPQLK
jgi:hypothetical protein